MYYYIHLFQFIENCCTMKKAVVKEIVIKIKRNCNNYNEYRNWKVTG